MMYVTLMHLSAASFTNASN